MHASRSFGLTLFALAAPVIAQGGWVQRLPAHSPPARKGHGFVFDVQRGVHVLFGGFNASTLLHIDTWEWNGLDWLRRWPAHFPQARRDHAMAYDFNRGRIVVFGGRVWSGSSVGDTWEFDGVDWAQRLPMQSPPARHLTSMAFSSARGRVILFGGTVGPVIQPMQDAWEWDGTNWAQLATSHAPVPRYDFAMTSDFARGRVLVVGGYDSNSNMLSDAWVFDGFDWTPLPATQSPSPRNHSALTADLARGMLVQFGGWTSGIGGQPTNECWLHDGSDWRLDARPPAIPPRFAVVFSYEWLRDRAVLFGGFDAGSLGDTWEYDLSGVALWWVSGAGCAGSQGAPQLQPAGPQRAVLGTSFGLAASGGVTGGALFAVGFSNTNWNGNALPMSLASFGMPGCQLHTSIEFSSFAAGVAGTAQLVVSLPNDPGLVGVRIFAQALVPQAGANPAGAAMSNAVVSVVGSF